MAKNLEFQISQLRQDKIIYAIEAVAINSACLVLAFTSSFILLPDWFLIIAVTFAILYTFYALIGNLFRLIKIKEFEKFNK